MRDPFLRLRRLASLSFAVLATACATTGSAGPSKDLRLRHVVLYQNGIGYFIRWFNFTGFREGVLVGGVMIIVGIIELFSELFRILTLTLRLWGNIWGGEIVLAVGAALLFVPSFSLIFIGLELFIGFIQAFVFAFLVLLYIILALESHSGEEHETHESEAHDEALPMAA